jgi:hypothetical protein
MKIFNLSMLVIMFLLGGLYAVSNEKNLEVKLEKYRKKKKELEDKHKATMAKENSYVVKAYESVISSYTKKGDLEKANEFLAKKKEFIENQDAVSESSDDSDETGDSDYPHEIESSLIKIHKFKNGNFIEIKKILGTEDEIKLKGKYKIIGTYNLTTESEGKLFLGIQPSKSKKSSDYKGDGHNIDIEKGKKEFEVYREFNISGLLHLSMYSESGRLGRIKISSR